jgi:hypothetical protein
MGHVRRWPAPDARCGPDAPAAAAAKPFGSALHDARLRAARDPDWLAEYGQHRPMVERTVAWLTRGNRRLRYRGIMKNDHWLHHRAAALNLRRLITHTYRPHAKPAVEITRNSHHISPNPLREPHCSGRS